MGLESGKQLIGHIKKYQYVLLVALAGVFLMLLPQEPESPSQPVSGEETALVDLETELADILELIAGVGKAQVLLTEDSGSDTIYQMDTGQNYSNQDTVILTDGSRQQVGLVKQVLAPCYRGAVIVCQGADDPLVRLSVVEAVKGVTGLSSDRITVFKMK